MSQIEEDSLQTLAEPLSVLKLKTCRLEQSKFASCLFVGTKVICVVYIDNLIFWSKDTLAIYDSAMELHELGMDLKQEDDDTGFFEVMLE
jgi:hypothetical protein